MWRKGVGEGVDLQTKPNLTFLPRRDLLLGLFRSSVKNEMDLQMVFTQPLHNLFIGGPWPNMLRVLSLLLTVAAASASCTPGLDFPNQDLPGSPLLGVPSPSACEALCAANSACSTFVFIAPNCTADPAYSRCYLKAGIPPSRPQLECYCGGQVSRPPPPPSPPSPGPALYTLTDSGALTATLGDRGLVGLALAGGATIAVGADGWSALVDGTLLNSSSLPLPIANPLQGSVEYVYAAIPGAAPGLLYTAIVTYTLPPLGGFVRKALSLFSSAPAAALEVALVAPWDALYLALPAPLAGAVYPSGALGAYAAFLRAADGTGVAVAAENPFLAPTAAPAFARAGALVTVGYAPGLTWNQTTPYDPVPRPFAADAGLLALYALSPNAVPPSAEGDAGTRRHGATRPYLRALRGAAAAAAVEATDTLTGMVFEYEALGGALPAGVHAHRGAPAPSSWLNYAERDAFRAMGEAAFAAAHGGTLPEPLRVHIPW